MFILYSALREMTKIYFITKQIILLYNCVLKRDDVILCFKKGYFIHVLALNRKMFTKLRITESHSEQTLPRV